MPTYNANIPQPNDILADSQDDILENFQQLNTAWNINHESFNNANQGKHTQITLPENVAPTNTLIDEANIYSQLSILTGVTELAWQRENNGAHIEWTGLKTGSNGWTRLPSGILVKWGGGSATGFNQLITFPVAADTPVFTALFNVIVTARAAGATSDLCNTVAGSFTIVSFNISCFDINGIAAAVPFSYVAIGT